MEMKTENTEKFLKQWAQGVSKLVKDAEKLIKICSDSADEETRLYFFVIEGLAGGHLLPLDASEEELESFKDALARTGRKSETQEIISLWRRARSKFLEIKNVLPEVKHWLEKVSETKIREVIPAEIREDFLSLMLQHGYFSDSAILKEISEAFVKNGDFPSGPQYDIFLERLSFSREHIPDERLTQAWSNYEHGFPVLLNEGIGEWYERNGKSRQAISVYEHLLRQLEEGEETDMLGLDTVKDLVHGCISSLADLYEEIGIFERAVYFFDRHLEYYQRGEISIVEYAEGLLRRNEIAKKIGRGMITTVSWDKIVAELLKENSALRETVEKFSAEKYAEVEKQLRKEFGGIWERFSPEARNKLVTGEMLYKTEISKTNPATVAINYCLFVEAELDKFCRRYLGDKATARHGSSISMFISGFLQDKFKWPLFERKIKQAGFNSLSNEKIEDLLDKIHRHRNRSAHATRYTWPELKDLHDLLLGEEKTIFNFLRALISIRGKRNLV